MRIAIAGQPNSGKTTMFNVLTGRRERVGNWAGVTVTTKEAYLKKRYSTPHTDIIVVDLPGAYSLNAYSNDELNASEFLQKNELDAIINVVDATNLERSLNFTLELIETGVPVIVALNKSDSVKRKGTKINTKLLSEMLNVPVVETVALSKKGLMSLMMETYRVIGVKDHGEKRHKKHSRIRSGKSCGCS